MSIRTQLGLAVVSVLLLATSAASAVVPHARVATRYPANSVGSDVSYPQCNPDDIGAVKTRATGQFGIVGLTNGRPYSYNVCGLSEWTDANALPNPPELYLNTANPAPTSSFYWPTSGARDPKLCINAHSVADAGCAYDYGWHYATDALSTALSSGITAAKSETWWLDVEADNTWNGSPAANASDLQGAIDYLRKQGVPAVGIYTSATAWKSVTGGYDKANAAAYTKTWQHELTASYPMTAAPMWKLGIGTKASAAAACKTASPIGSPTWLSQYAGKIDQDLACPSEGTPTFTVTIKPTHMSASRGQKKTVTIKITESGPTQPIHLTLKSPAGVKTHLSKTTVTGPATVQLTVTPSRAAPRGVHTLTLTATGTTAIKSKKDKIKIA